jgi:FMN phosphatase YigB (HAD superfamily)
MKTPIQAILFDLDGTLLDNNMDLFLPPYFKLLSARVAHILQPEPFIAHLLAATDAMLTNDGRMTNAEAFAAAFYPLAGYPREEVEPIFEAFYAHDFPTLRAYTRCKPEARAVVQQALDAGYDLAVATNPLFPAAAIEQRLEWAGLDDLPFRIVTSYENSRATKPNLLYFQHILETLDQPPERSLVVGDEDMDMVAAHLGCPTFLVPGPRTELSPATPEPTYRGSLADLRALLQTWPDPA